MNGESGCSVECDKPIGEVITELVGETFEPRHLYIPGIPGPALCGYSGPGRRGTTCTRVTPRHCGRCVNIAQRMFPGWPYGGVL